MGEADAATDYSGCKPRQAKFTKTYISMCVGFRKGDVNMNRANTVLPHREAIYCKGCMVLVILVWSR